MLTWMAYATVAGSLLAAAGAVLEHFSPWLAGRRRLLWLGVIAGSLLFAAIGTLPSSTPSVSASGSANTPTRASRGSPVTTKSAPSTEHARVSSQASRAVAADALPPDSSRLSALGVDALLAAFWLVATALCLGVLLMSAWRVARMRRTWREGVLAGVPVFVSHDVGPAVISLVHHGIVVPAWVETLADDEQRLVMTHEREHVRAGDPLLLWGATLLVTIAPWNLALWYALRRLRHAIEIDCDGRVLRSRPDARAYCTLLLDVGERTLAGVAPVAALAEPATLLERRIVAMTAPVRVRRGRVAASAAAAATLVAAACFTPRPKVAPAARVSAFISTLGVGHRESDSALATVSPRSESARPTFEGGPKVVQLARDSFPEAFQPREDAIVVMSVFDSHFQPLANFVQTFRVDDVFDVLPESRDSIVGMRNGPYLISRVIPGWHPRLQMSGTETMREAGHAVFAWAVLMPDETLPRTGRRRSQRPQSFAPSRSVPEGNGAGLKALR